jgi:predicted nucleotidyltransferase
MAESKGRRTGRQREGGWIMSGTDTVAVPPITVRRRIPRRAIHHAVQQILHKFQPLKAVLLASYAYAEPSPDIDVDVLVLLETLKSVSWLCASASPLTTISGST